MSENQLSKFQFKREVIQRWKRYARGIANDLLKRGAITLEEVRLIPDEDVRQESDGSLTIFLPFRGEEFKMRVEPGEWVYATQTVTEGWDKK